MANVILTEEEILEKKFNASKNGYNPLEVDRFLDKLVLTVHDLNGIIAKLDSDKLELSKKIRALEDKISELKTNFEIFKTKYKNIKESDFIDFSTTIEQIKKINIYETKLHSLGVDVKALVEKETKK